MDSRTSSTNHDIYMSVGICCCWLSCADFDFSLM